MSEAAQPWSLGPTHAPLPPLVRGLPLLGSALDFGRDPVKALLAWHREHGPIYRLRLAGNTYTVLGGVEANRFAAATRYDAFANYDTFIDVISELGTKKNLAVLDGEEHARFRAVAQSSYSRSAMAGFLPVVHRTLEHLLASLEAGQHFEVFPALQRLVSLQLGEGVAQTRVDDDVHALQAYMRYLMFAYIARVWPAWTRHLPAVKRAREASHAAIDRVLELHQRRGGGQGLIDKFLVAHREDPLTFPLDAVRAASFGPFLAGQDTVAATTAYALAAVYSRPDLRDALQREVDALFARGLPDAAAYKQAALLNAVVRETLRLYPVAPFLPKTAACEFEFAGYRVPRGAQLFFFQARSHFEAEHYPEPWSFDVQRPAPRAAVFAPFGVGPHTCIGAGMGELQVQANVASLMRLGRFELYPAGYVLANRQLPLSPRGFHLKLARKSAPVAPPLGDESAGRTVRSSLFGSRTLGEPLPPARRGGANFVVPPVDIDAPLERVWEILTDWARYPEWCPLNRGIEVAGRGAVGDELRLSVSWGPYRKAGEPVDVSALRTHLTNRERLTILDPPYCVAWGDDLGLLHRAERIQFLERLPGGRTRYHTDERMAGLLSPLIARVYRARILDGFASCGLALKGRAEGR